MTIEIIIITPKIISSFLIGNCIWFNMLHNIGIMVNLVT